MAKVTYNKWKTFRKGLGPALGAYFVGHMAGVDIATILANPGEQIPVIVATLLAGAIPVVVNLFKTAKLEGNPLKRLKRPSAFPNVYRGLLALALPAAMLAGCITTTAPDGTVTTQLDPVALDTAWAAYERLEARKAELKALEAEANARDRARIALELQALEPELRAVARTLGLSP